MVYKFNTKTRFSTAFAAARSKILNWDTLSTRARFDTLDALMLEAATQEFMNWNGGNNLPTQVEMLDASDPRHITWEVSFSDPTSAMLWKLSQGDAA